MDRESLAALLEEGIRSAQMGDHAQARSLLLQVVQEDERLESAWLWLSRVVDDEEEQRVCLENALTLNPGNQAARKDLAQLGGPLERMPGRHVREPISPAAAMLYPERHKTEWTWQDDTALRRAPAVGYASQSAYDDVWEREDDLCAYCARSLEPGEKKCPQCGRKLVASDYRYERASSDLYSYFVLLLGLAQISLALVFADLLSLGSPAVMAWNTLVFLGTGVLALGVYFRRFWAYAGSIFSLLLVLAVMLLDLATGGGLQRGGQSVFGQGLVDMLTVQPIQFLGPLADLLRPLQLLVTLLALLLAALRVGPDFERVHKRRVAELKRGLKEADEFYAAGKRLAQREMWASAVLHWRRAAAREPAQVFYQHQLGFGYAHLGFYRRGLDVLESAQRLTTDPGRREELAAEIDRLRPLAAEETVPRAGGEAG